MRIRLIAVAVSATVLACGCGMFSVGGKLVKSEKPRDESPRVKASDRDSLVAGNTEFALDLYHQLAAEKPDENLFFSPHSLSTALAMVYAGAREETEAQMADVLHFSQPQEDLHAAFNALDLKLSRDIEGDFELHIANALWCQTGYEFLPDYLDVLAVNYGAGMRLLDFASKPERARAEINQWASKQTRGKIEDLIPAGLIDPLARLVIANAVYFDAAWESTFKQSATHEQPFTLLDGAEVTVDMMHQTHRFDYAEGDGWQAVSLPYDGGEFSMVVLLPAREQFSEFDAALDGPRLAGILDALARQEVRLSMPKFDSLASFLLRDALAALGMPDAFVWRQADLSGMDGTRELFVVNVVHKAVIEVDEERTVAAAATAVPVAASAPPSEPEIVEMTIDHPFILLIRDEKTGAILFLGRVLDPTAA
jgi:serpin B